MRYSRDMDFVFIYITNPTKKDARGIAHHLIKKRLIACANIFPINSLYRWEGRICDEKEFVVIAKTTKTKFKKVKTELEKIHPYKIPCIVKIPVSSNDKFFRWLKNEVRG